MAGKRQRKGDGGWGDRDVVEESKLDRDSLEYKLESWRRSRQSGKLNRLAISKRCEALERDVGVRIEPRCYKFLHGIAEELGRGREPDMRVLALEAGYARHMARNARTEILRRVDDRIFEAIVGISRQDVHMELGKMIGQDADLSLKMRGLELASKVTGMQGGDGEVGVNINLGDIKLGE